ncbi:SRPBCC family protein [Longimicrobium sp.]|uniref:SRPBCC family protein n=1 Tax=Longimicrobium sp. TaxID=2029185 RepID=UPI002C1F43FA|nr:SRPBCC family protein [Longimicrobium sp.]HSU13039.1 SRPBCC family protein [Longimicrobium sp.]
MLLIIALVLVAAIAALLAFAATRPDTFRVERSATISAPAARIFPHLDDFHRWSAWSPWEKIDPALKRTWSGAEHGPGAVYGWEGNSKVGQGRMEIVESDAPSRLRIQLDFLKPFEAHHTAVFTMVPESGGTRVTWAMHGNHTFATKVMCLFMPMDRMVGPDFERGLANLKSVAESEPAPQPA